MTTKDCILKEFYDELSAKLGVHKTQVEDLFFEVIQTQSGVVAIAKAIRKEEL